MDDSGDILTFKSTYTSDRKLKSIHNGTNSSKKKNSKIANSSSRTNLNTQRSSDSQQNKLTERTPSKKQKIISFSTNATKKAYQSQTQKNQHINEYFTQYTELQLPSDSVTEHQPLKIQNKAEKRDASGRAKTSSETEDKVTLLKALKFCEKKIHRLEKQLELKNELIHKIEKEVCALRSKFSVQDQSSFYELGSKYDVERCRDEQRRLLNMLQKTEQYKHFADFAAGDDGIRYLSQIQPFSEQNSGKNNRAKRNLQSPTHRNHYCTCNTQKIAEFNLWAPQSVYSFGQEFIRQREGQLTKSEFQLLLYELNKLWREREKRIINTLKSYSSFQIGKIKRALQTERSSRSRIRSLRK